MSRPKKCRKVCYFPQTLAFAPVENKEEKPAVILTVDEYETIRLIDKEGLSQEQCGTLMEIARTTVQQIYTSARRKLADALVDGQPLRIEGGDYKLCDGQDTRCCFHTCCRQKFHQQPTKQYTKSKGEYTMRIAVTYENGQIFQHFGHTEQFKLYDVEDDKITGSKVIDTNGNGHGALAGFLTDYHVDALICGGIGSGAQTALSKAGIKLYGGVTGDADSAAEALIAGTLAFHPDVQCSHHGEHHHDATCGNHSCRKHH